MKSLRASVLIVAVLAASGCGAMGGMFKSKPKADDVPQEGRVSLLAFDQQLTADPQLASRKPLVPAPVDLKDWPQPGGTPDNAPGNIAADSSLKVIWRAGLGGASRQERLSAPPVISDGKLYILDAGQTLRAMDAATGKGIWSKALRPAKSEDKSAIGGGVAVADGRVYAASGFGEIVAFKADSGEEVWRTHANAPFHAAPTAGGGRVYAVTNDSELVALDSATGELQWNYQAIAEPARILAASSPAVVGDIVYVPFASGELVALQTANGHRLWNEQLTRNGKFTSLSAINDIAGRPVVSEGVIYAASHSGKIEAIDGRSGQGIWERLVASTQTPCVVGDTVYIVTIDGELAAMDKTSGAAFWVKQLPRYENVKKSKGRIAWSGPIMVGGALFLASSEGDALLLAPDDGATKQTIKLGKAVFLPPVAANATVYVVADDGALIALR
jgi:outer membrane protein assembly factor BamB